MIPEVPKDGGGGKVPLRVANGRMWRGVPQIQIPD